MGICFSKSEPEWKESEVVKTQEYTVSPIEIDLGSEKLEDLDTI